MTIYGTYFDLHNVIAVQMKRDVETNTVTLTVVTQADATEPRRETEITLYARDRKAFSFRQEQDPLIH